MAEKKKEVKKETGLKMTAKKVRGVARAHELVCAAGCGAAAPLLLLSAHLRVARCRPRGRHFSPSSRAPPHP
jgi:hypothetical protein